MKQETKIISSIYSTAMNAVRSVVTQLLNYKLHLTARDKSTVTKMAGKEVCCGPGYATPLEAMKNGPREELLYVVCIQPNSDKTGTGDYLATIDVNPNSPDYCKVIHRLPTGNIGDELHHTGWNVCSSCHHNCSKKRDKLIMPGLKSSNIYVADVSSPRHPVMHKVINANELKKINCTRPHTTHCAPSCIMISTMGDNDGNGKGEIVKINPETFEVIGTWTKGCKIPPFGYDFWYQPYFDVLVASEWGSPTSFEPGFNPADATNNTKYGKNLNFYSWNKQQLEHSFDLQTDGMMPLEVRFLHDPKKSIGFVGCALNGVVYRFHRHHGHWKVEKAIEVRPVRVTGWIGDFLSGLITDILISLDDKFLYLANWLQGDIRQYDITDPFHPKLVGQIYIGGKMVQGSSVQVIDPEGPEPIEPVVIKGRTLEGSPQMIQLSLDGKRMYATSSLYSTWDKQIYPNEVQAGSFMVQIDVNNKTGGLTLNKNFLVDFGTEPNGPILAHEIRYPGGDCSSDIWLAPENC